MDERDFIDLMGLQDGNGLVKTIDGEVCLSSAGAMCLALSAMHDEDVPADGRAAATATVDRLLAGARRRGFGKGDILLTLVAGGERSPRIVELVREALDGATPEELASAFGPIRRSDEA
jgi:hypothetical protein